MVLSDINTYRQVIGCLMKKPLLFTEYQDLRIQDFDLKVPRIVFSVIKNMFESGAMELSPVEVDLEIDNHEAISVIYKSNHGLDFLKESYEYSRVENFEYYYKRLKKLSLLRELKKNNYDISSYYKENFESLKEEEKANELFESSSVDDILMSVEGKYNKIKNDFINGGKHSGNAANGLRELVDELMLKPEIGPALCGDYFSTACRGARLGKYYLRSASSGSGKRIADYTPIPTPEGWKTVGDIKVGDYIFGKNGQPTKVLKLYKNTEKIWKISFSDGRTIDCCGEHLWEYYYKSHRGYEKRVENTQTIYARAKRLKNGFKTADNGGWRFKIPMNEAVEYPEQSFKISPYAMGLALGDGSFRNGSAFTFSSSTDELPILLAKELGENITYKKDKCNYTYYFYTDREQKNRYKLKDFLEEELELIGAYSQDKYIPKKYLLSSTEQRFELLRGLLDTDGSIDEDKGRIRFTTISKRMAEDVSELCHSLGMITGISVDTHREYKNSNGECYIVTIQCKKELKPFLFKLEKKKTRAINFIKSRKRTENKDKLSIINIEPTEESTSMTCFTVDAEDCLFQVGDFIVTHNTRLAVFDACKICFPIHYSLDKGTFVVEVDDKGEVRPPRKTLIITTEMGKDEIQTIVLAYLSGVNEAHILTGKYELGEKDRVYYATQIVEKYQNYFYIEEISDPNLTNVESTIKRYATIEEVDFVFYDYIFSSPSLVSQFSDSKLREDVVLMMLSNQLKQLAKDYNIFIFSSTQVNANAMTEEGFKNESCIRGM